MAGNIPGRPKTTHDRVAISIVASLYHEQFVNGLIDAAREEILQVAPNAMITVYRVPGAFEIPVCAETVLRHSGTDVVMALGVIIRGETEHGDLVAASVTDALQKMAVSHAVPVVHEVLLLDSEEQAEERCLGATINRGTEAARVALNMVALLKQMRSAFGVAKPSTDFGDD
jgi:6,7-dimethyl-8-ribityllumazine synthase